MKKNMLTICLAALLLTGCGAAESKQESADTSAQQETAAQQETPAESSEETEPAAEESSAEEPEMIDWNGISVPIPAGFTYDTDYSLFRVWNGSAGTSAEIHLIAHELFGYSQLEDAVPNYTLADVPDIMDQTLRKAASYYAEADIADTTRTPQKTEDAEYLGEPALRETGTIRTKNADGEHVYSYAAIYSSLQFPYYGADYEALPASIFAFAESEDAAVKQALENVVDTAAKESVKN